MCKTVINRMDLGNRVTGYEMFNSATGEIVGFSPKQVKDNIEEIRGLKVDETTGEIELDDKFFMKNLIIKTGINTTTPLFEEECIANVLFTLIGMKKEGNTTSYEIINSRFKREWIPESKLKALIEVGMIQGGCDINAKGKLVIAPSILKDFEEKQAENEEGGKENE